MVKRRPVRKDVQRSWKLRCFRSAQDRHGL